MDTSVVSKIDEYQQVVLDEWAADEAVAAWHRWLPKQIGQFSPVTQLLAEAAGVQAGDVVLDLGSGAGDPALTLAEIVGPTGRVVATDLVDAMARCCAENALARGLENVESRQADAQDLPFADGTFDRVTSKLGAMYFADFQRAAAEIRRVLKPGGRVALACWGPVEQNPYVLLQLGPFLARLTEAPAPPPPDMPNPFRFAQAGTLSAALEQAGFQNVREETVVIPMPWAGPPEEHWQNFYDVARPVRPLIDGFGVDEREAAIGEALAGLRQHYDGVYTSPPGAFVIASGER
jgi:ubiquinone/menaquinone biosynthesis C-methylase UbiE